MGALVSLSGAVTLSLGPPASIAAALALAVQAAKTGHARSGPADCCNGFWGGWTRTRRLQIMKDSAIGTYGMPDLLLCVLARWSALAPLFESGAVWGR
ncbi:adenosylcobinamide-GDP ribazoletransferase [Plastorhodobacter daqingensis]|uniref:Adenosylcobinamide-GDP ribazoletransferase n=1 Tax=Plastorhodobacter daqingensis TaxID=1387281 RepID=A0ABW2UH76_9RHOB